MIRFVIYDVMGVIFTVIDVVFIEEVAEKCKALSKMFSHQLGSEVIFTDEQAQSVCVFKVVSKDFTGKKKTRPNIV